MNASNTITLSSMPQKLFSGTLSWANHVQVSVVPGGTGKVYVGQSSMDVSTGEGIAQILFPNSGAHSEFFDLTDPSGDDTINLSDLYVVGDVPGEFALVSWTCNTGTGGANQLVLMLAKKILPLATGDVFIGGLAGADTPCSKIRVQVIPGGSQKVTLFNGTLEENSPYYQYFHVLFPNSGNIAQHSAWSEFWELQDPTGQNGITDAIGFQTQEYGDGVQAAVWQLQNTLGDPVEPLTSYSLTVTGGGGVGAPDEYPIIMPLPLKIRAIPGYCDKSYFGGSSLSIAYSLDLYKVLYPNCTGGWSEQFSAYSNVYAAILTTGYFGLSTETTLVTVPSTNSGGTVSVSSTPTAVGSGLVHRLLISVIPGFTGKVFIGNSSMNTSTLAGVFAILYPNSVGRWSEEYELVDPQGDGVPADSIYVVGGVPGDLISVMMEVQGVSVATPLSLKAAGPLSSGSSTATLFSATSIPVVDFRVQAIPGGSGKIRVGTSAMTATQPDSAFASTVRVLWPSQGNYDIHEGFSESFRATSPDGSNSSDVSNFSFFSEVLGEQILVGAWGR